MIVNVVMSHCEPLTSTSRLDGDQFATEPRKGSVEKRRAPFLIGWEAAERPISNDAPFSSNACKVGFDGTGYCRLKVAVVRFGARRPFLMGRRPRLFPAFFFTFSSSRTSAKSTQRNAYVFRPVERYWDFSEFDKELAWLLAVWCTSRPLLYYQLHSMLETWPV